MKKFEYRIEAELSSESMNLLGQAGWELVAVVVDQEANYKTFLYFKRELPEAKI